MHKDLLCTFANSMNNPRNKTDFLNGVNTAIEQLMDENRLSVIQLACRLNMQPQQLRRIMKSITGKSSAEYIAEQRIMYAKQLLIKYDLLTIAEISNMCGFDEPTHFTRFFKRLTGITPIEFRKK